MLSPRILTALLLPSVLLLAGTACSSARGDLAAGEACARTQQCGAGLACSLGICSTDLTGLGGEVPMPPNPDAGAGVDALGVDAAPGPDAAPFVDSGGVDSGTPDAGIPDTGMPDSGMPDTGMPDTGMPDAGMPDTGMPDTGTPDAGAVDAAADAPA